MIDPTSPASSSSVGTSPANLGEAEGRPRPVARSGPSGGQAGDEDGNLMWLVDFKLDFFNDIEKNGGDYSFKRISGSNSGLMIRLFIHWVQI